MPSACNGSSRPSSSEVNCVVLAGAGSVGGGSDCGGAAAAEGEAALPRLSL